jgi:HAD superfamily hydrolase (TIGR01509 family)
MRIDSPNSAPAPSAEVREQEVGAALEMVFFDIGGVMYDDTIYARAIHTALRTLGASFSDREFDDVYRAARAAQSGSFRGLLARRFLGPDADMAALEAEASKHWSYPPEALHDDVRPCLTAIAGRYRLGIIANQPSAVKDVIHRDGLDGFFEVWGVSDDVGLEKPDPALFAHVLHEAGAEPSTSVMVGDRLDYDVRPAKAAGMRAVWVLRGEAPDDPTPEQLAEADAAIHGLTELPAALESLEVDT